MDANGLSLFILQLAVGLTFAAHGAQKVFGWWGGPGLTAWEGAMAHMGFRPARLFGHGIGPGRARRRPAARGRLPHPARGRDPRRADGRDHRQGPPAARLLQQQVRDRVPARPRRRRGRRRPGRPGAIGIDAALGLAVDPTIRALLLVAGIVVGLATLAVPGLESRLASRTHATAR